MTGRWVKFSSTAALLVGACCTVLSAQEAIQLPAATASQQQPRVQSFSFASDGPTGPGWSRPDDIARTYFAGELPALFRRTIVLDQPVPQKGKLSWIFTGPHAGFTVELTPSKVRLVQRFFDSSGLWAGSGGIEKIVRDDEQQYVGEARTVTVVLDAHLSVQVLVNGIVVLKQTCNFDLTRHQLMFSAPRNQHITVAGALLAPPVQDASIRVDAGDRHQTVLGFGGSPSIPTYARFSEAGKEAYWAILKRYNLLLDREYPMGSELKPDLTNMDDLQDATPHYYGDNFPNGEVSDFDYSRRALAMGGDVIYEMWALPRWAMQPYTVEGKPIMDAWNKPVKSAAKPEEYVRIVVTYCRKAKERTGHAPTIVGIQNEVEQAPEVFAQMTVLLRQELDKAGFQTTKIHMADASFLWMGIDRTKQLHDHAEAWRATDYTASHEYDWQEFFANPDMFDARLDAMHAASGDKPFLTTELCLNDPHYQELSYRIAFNQGQLYMKNLVRLDSIGIMYAWTLLDVEQPNFGGSRALLIPDKTNGYMPVASSFELRVLGAFSRHVLKGMVRVGSTSSNSDLLTAAFEDAHRASIVAMNRSTEPQRLALDWKGRHWVQMERTSQTAENATSSTIPAELIVQPGEIVTISDFIVN